MPHPVAPHSNDPATPQSASQAAPLGQSGAPEELASAHYPAPPAPPAPATSPLRKLRNHLRRPTTLIRISHPHKAIQPMHSGANRRVLNPRTIPIESQRTHMLFDQRQHLFKNRLLPRQALQKTLLPAHPVSCRGLRIRPVSSL